MKDVVQNVFWWPPHQTQQHWPLAWARVCSHPLQPAGQVVHRFSPRWMLPWCQREGACFQRDAARLVFVCLVRGKGRSKECLLIPQKIATKNCRSARAGCAQLCAGCGTVRSARVAGAIFCWIDNATFCWIEQQFAQFLVGSIEHQCFVGSPLCAKQQHLEVQTVDQAVGLCAKQCSAGIVLGLQVWRLVMRGLTNGAKGTWSEDGRCCLEHSFNRAVIATSCWHNDGRLGSGGRNSICGVVLEMPLVLEGSLNSVVGEGARN